MLLYFSCDTLSQSERDNVEFWEACKGKSDEPIMKGNREKVEDILARPWIGPPQLLELLKFEHERYTALDFLFEYKDERCIQAIVEHVTSVTKDLKISCAILPYAAVVKSINLVNKITKNLPQCSGDKDKIIKFHQSCTFKLLQTARTHQDNMTALHIVSKIGNTEGALTLLDSLNTLDKMSMAQILLTKDRFKKTALHYSCKLGETKLASALLASLEVCGPEAIKDALMMQDKDSRSALYDACRLGHSEIVSDILDTLRHCNSEYIRKVLLLEGKGKQTALKVAMLMKCRKPIILIALLAVQDEETHRTLKLLAHTRKESDMNPFEEVDSESWHFVLSHILERIKAIEHEISKYENKADQLRRAGMNRECNIEHELKKKEEEKVKKYISRLPFLPLIAAEKNKFGQSLYHFDDLLPIHAELLEKCQKYSMDTNDGPLLKDMFPSFYYHQRENISYSKAYNMNPLKMIAKSGHLALIKHPYVVTYVDICWGSLARSVFGLNVFFYLLYLILMGIFFSTHTFPDKYNVTEFSFDCNKPNETDTFQNIHFDIARNLSCKTDSKSSLASITLASMIGLLSILGITFEAFQFHIKREHYWKQLENWVDLSLFSFTIVILIVILAIGYNEVLHGLGCVLILVAGLRGAWMLTHVQFLGIGNGFRMLFGVLFQVIKFGGPILTFFILLFFVVYHNLLKNQEQFSTFLFSITKIMAMTIGEAEFGSTFLDEDNGSIFRVIALLIFAIFLLIMTVSMINLLIGLAVPSVDALEKKGEQADFKSKVDLIYQCSYMRPDKTKTIHVKALREIYENKWGKWQDISAIENKEVKDRWDNEKRQLEEGKKKNEHIRERFRKYLLKLEKEYRVSVDAIREEETFDEALEKSNLIVQQNEDIKNQIATSLKQKEDIKLQNENLKKQMLALTQQYEEIKKQITIMQENINKQREEMTKYYSIQHMTNMIARVDNNMKEQMVKQNKELLGQIKQMLSYSENNQPVS